MTAFSSSKINTSKNQEWPLLVKSANDDDDGTDSELHMMFKHWPMISSSRWIQIFISWFTRRVAYPTQVSQMPKPRIPFTDDNNKSIPMLIKTGLLFGKVQAKCPHKCQTLQNVNCINPIFPTKMRKNSSQPLHRPNCLLICLSQTFTDREN